MKAPTSLCLALCLLLMLQVLGCRVVAGGDGDGDGDADGDVDGDGDGDGDGDSDGDVDGDSDGDGDGDVDHYVDGYCLTADGIAVNECGTCLPADVPEAVHSALTRVFPTADMISLVGSGEDTYFVAELDGDTLGYAFLDEGWGFEGMVQSMTGVDADGVSIRVEITEAHDYEWTYSLGAYFFDRLACIDLDLLDITTHDWGPYTIDARTGATMTAQAVIEGVWYSLEHYQQVTE